MSVSFWVGRRVGLPFLETYGRKVHITPERLHDVAQEFALAWTDSSRVWRRRLVVDEISERSEITFKTRCSWRVAGFEFFLRTHVLESVQ
jgi:hypothetical protein